MKFFAKIKEKFKEISEKIDKIKNNINDFKESAKDSIFTKIAYWLFMIFFWWPIKYSFIVMYYLVVWPFLKILGSASSASYDDFSYDESSSTNDAYKQRSEDARAKTDAANRKLKVQFWSDTHWVDASHISGANANRIGIELDRVSKQRPGKRVRCIDVETGNVVDVR